MRISRHPILKNNKNKKTVKFTFNGKEYNGLEGEMVSSALLANGIKHFSIHQKDDAAQGIFCANGQCAQCTVMIDGTPLKSCVTPLREGMNVNLLVHLPDVPWDTTPLTSFKEKNFTCDVLVIGGGPSGLTSALELAKLGFEVLLVDDKDRLGGKLLLQTHKFFGSEEDCYAGTRGFDIAKKLEDELSQYRNVKILTQSSVVGIYKDKKAGIFVSNKNYCLAHFDGIIVSCGAREKSLVFHGNDLPGIYGAGAFQTLVNRDFVKSSDRILIVGSGNVGLISAYHALQVGIEVIGIVEIQNMISGYKVHADKIKRMGVPVYLNTTVLSVEGDSKVERVTVATVDENWSPILDSAKTFEADTVLVAAGLTPVNEFFEMADSFGFKVIKTGDAEEIAEASSAMFGGRIAGLKMAKLLGADIVIDDTFFKKADILKSRPGLVLPANQVSISSSFQPVFSCVEEIPCNPCATVCPQKAIRLKNKSGTIMDVPQFVGNCTGCGLCVAACPGLAISLVKKIDAKKALVVLPHEFEIDFKIGDSLPLTDIDGEFLENGIVKKILFNKKYCTHLITFETSINNALRIFGIRVQKKIESLKTPVFNYLPDDSIVCRCERVTLKEVVNFIRENDIRDINQLKQIRVGMGACGSKTCSVQFPRVFKEAGVDWSSVAEGSIRPLTVETPIHALLNEEV